MKAPKTNSSNKDDWKGMLPGSVHGWRALDPDREFDKDTLFDLIDGGAEVYRSLNVKKVLSRVYQKEGAPDIFVDLFDMGSSEDAFGAYHHDIREEVDPGIGQASEFQGGSLYFWRDRFFVSIVALANTKETKAATLAIGRQISKAIGKDGPMPPLVDQMPKKGLQKAHLYFFHDAETLDRRYAVGAGNPLHLSANTDGLLGVYRLHLQAQKKESSAVFLAIAYPAYDDAKVARKDLFETLFQRAETGDAFDRGSGKWAGVRIEKSHLFAVLEASDQAMVRHLLGTA
ncbi:MAG: hypothetical protein QNJ97_04575 [Myxococcota bacterium]|nr:hypothetical protein [Myxococcota bacterium]